MTDYTYEINPRPVELGGGWNLRLLEDGEEVGGGVFPAVRDDANPLYPFDQNVETHTIRRRQPSEAETRAAYAEAQAEADEWLASRAVERGRAD